MTGLSTRAKLTDAPMASAERGIARDHSASNIVIFGLIAFAAFTLYMGSAVVLEARKATTHFGADSWYYAGLANGNILARVAGDYHLDRVARFHPATVVMAAVWMQLLSPLTRWIAPLYLLKAMFAAVGAAGLCAALSAFAAVLPRRLALVFGVVYAVSLGVWYFASFEESKIVTATLSALYIAVYLRVRDTWTIRGIGLLSAVLLVACLNEMVSGFLVAIPAIDMLMRHGWDWRRLGSIAAHALAGPLAFAIIEGVLYGRLTSISHPEGTSHFGMLIFYISRNYYSLSELYAFVINWLFFNIAAPSRDASYWVPAWANYKGYFVPSLWSYLTSPTSTGAAVVGVALAASALFRNPEKASGTSTGLLWGLLAYTLVRAVFFFVFNPYEPLLFSPAVTLAHLLIIAVPLAASSLPAKTLILGIFAVLLFVANGAFILGP